MFSKNFRLTKNREFAKVARQGNFIYNRFLNLKWIKNDLDYSRFGIVVSLKVDKKAVVRNKIKRRIREIIRKDLKEIAPGYDFLILTKDKIKELDYQEIKKQLFKVLERVENQAN